MKSALISLATMVVVVAVVFFGIKILKATAPTAEKKEIEATIPVVETEVVQQQDVGVPLTSEGVVMTRRETILSSQVGGRLNQVHPQFEIGATFKTGEIIARIDPLDFRSALAQARSTLADAELEVSRERARGEQALRDWKKIGGGKKPSDLVLRKPFLASAEARVVAAKAMVEKAAEDLERTMIRAPFDCKVKEVSLNLGATVAPGTRLGMIYDPNQLMVQLPFSMDDYAEIPKDAKLTLNSEIGGRSYEWEAEVMWDLGQIGKDTLAAYLLAKVLPNEKLGEKFRLPTPGLFLDAALTGAVLKDVVVVPREAVRGRDGVWVLSENETLEVRKLTVARTTSEAVYATEGIEDGEKVILTKVEMAVEGMTLSEAKEETSNETSVE